MKYNTQIVLAYFKSCGLPEPVLEHPFVVLDPKGRDRFLSETGKPRAWRFDFAWTVSMVALEVDGGIFRRGGGAHQGAGAKRDIEKGNAAVILGWRVLRVMPERLCMLETAEMLKEVLSK